MSNPSQPQESISNFLDNGVLFPLILLAVAFGIYANTLGHAFVLDDYMVIKNNAFTKAGFAGIWDILTKDSFYGYFVDMKEDARSLLVSGGRYRPLSLILFAMIYQIFGGQPFIFHLFTVLLYASLVLVIYKTLQALMQYHFEKSLATSLAFLSALLYAVHPLHTEAVANIKGCDEILALLFSMIALHWAMEFRNSNHVKYRWLSATAFFLACMSKENALTFIIVIPLAWYFFRGSRLGSFTQLISAIGAATILFIILRGQALHWQFSNQQPMELLNNPFIKLVGDQWQPFSSSEKLGTIMLSLWKYLSLLVFPHPLTHDYYPRQIETTSILHIKALLILSLFMAMSGYSIVAYRKKNLIGFLCLYFIITLSIVSNLFFSVGTLMNERFLFMPSLSFSVMMAYGAILLIKKGFKIPSYALLLCVLVLHSYKTITRNKIWIDNETLFIEDVKVSTRSAKAHDDCGGVIFNKASKMTNGNDKNQLLDEAISHFDEAMKIKPIFKHAHMHKAAALHLKGQYDQSIILYRKAKSIWSDDPKINPALALSLREKGFEKGKVGPPYELSRTFLMEAAQLDDSDGKTQWLIGISYAKEGKIATGIPYLQKACALMPNNAGYHYDLGTSYFKINDKINGELYYKKALSLNPNIAAKRTKK